MKTLIAYYSQGGSTRAVCEAMKNENTDLYEIKEVKKRGVFGAFTSGAFGAIKGRGSKIAPVELDTQTYNRIILAHPIWASSVPPAVISFLEQAPISGKDVIVMTFSSSGDDFSSKVRPVIERAGAKLTQIYSLKKGEMPKVEII